jgi:hypothetical protein
VQLKVDPLIFALMLVDDWRDWRVNLRRFALLAAVNGGLLFIGGYRLFLDFLRAVTQQLVEPTMNYWNGNHSIKAFVHGLSNTGYGLIPKSALPAWRSAAPTIEAALLIVLAACILVAIVRQQRSGAAGTAPTVMLVCTMAALMVPISNDYKLAILAAPMSVALAAAPEGGRRRPAVAAVLVLAGAAYTSLLFPFKYKPYYLWNSFPALLLILLSMSLLDLLGDRRGRRYAEAEPWRGRPA